MANKAQRIPGLNGERQLWVDLGGEQAFAPAVSVVDGSIAVEIDITHTHVAVGADSTPLIATNARRRYLLLVNDSDEAIYITAGDTALLNRGIRLNSLGGRHEMSAALGNLYTGALAGICTSGNKSLLITEGE